VFRQSSELLQVAVRRLSDDDAALPLLLLLQLEQVSSSSRRSRRSCRAGLGLAMAAARGRPAGKAAARSDSIRENVAVTLFGREATGRLASIYYIV
jgi:hypothetical protein